VNNHLQLLWQSVFAPRAAVDLAKQHPDTYKLGWIYVAAMIAASLIAELIVREYVRPFLGIVVNVVDDPWAWLDTIVGTTALSIIVCVVLYVAQRWFWRRVVSASVTQHTIDAAIIASFALSIVLVLPQFIIGEFTQKSGGIVLVADIAAQIAIYIGFSTVYFSHAMQMSLGKSFVLNLYVFVLVFIISVFLYFLLLVLIAVLTGTSLAAIFAMEELVQ
jgi:hypothetical protein